MQRTLETSTIFQLYDLYIPKQLYTIYINIYSIRNIIFYTAGAYHWGSVVTLTTHCMLRWLSTFWLSYYNYDSHGDKLYLRETEAIEC